MNEAFFADLDIPQPNVNLGVGSGSHAVQTAEVMRRIEPVLDEHAPDLLLVVGDVNSTLAAALVAAKKGIAIAHVEAGLRSRDRTMPEEINRVLTDQIADLLFTTERDAADNLRREGIDGARIHFVGNVMIDALKRSLPRAVPSQKLLSAHGHAPVRKYAVLTLHRPSNVDDGTILGGILETVADLGRTLPVVFPIHPRARSRIDAAGLQSLVAAPAVLALPPVGYAEMLGLISNATLVMTDSGGVQEETTSLGVPCLTLRETTERPITVKEGTNEIVGNSPEKIRAAFLETLKTGGKTGRQPELWDGEAAKRIAAILVRHIDSAN